MRRAVDALLSVLLAPSCAACDRPLDCPTGGPVCPDCWASILPLTPPLCESCGDPLRTWRAAGAPLGRCARCRRLRCSVTKARAIGAYEGALRSIIHALKYDGRRSLARRLGGLMGTRGADVLAGADYVVAVPLHRSRRRTRGFNQAEDLARHVGLPVIEALGRIRATSAQADLPAARRHGNVRDAFGARRSVTVLCDRVVVLIDDVSTTGATLNACGDVLLASGVREVRALTAARVLTQQR